MKRIMFLIGSRFLLAICLSACRFSALPVTETPTELPSPAPTETLSQTATHTMTAVATETLAPTATRSVTPTHEPAATIALEEEGVCTIDGTIQRAEAVFPDRDIKFTVESYPAFGLKPFTFIYVDEKIINPETLADSVFSYVEKALYEAVEMSREFVNSDPCIDELFNQISPVILDKNHNGWLAVQWNLSDIPREEFPSDSALDKLMENMTVSYVRQEPTLKFNDPPQDSCSWEEIEDKIYWHFGFEGTPPGREIYLIIDHEVTIWAHWGESDFELGYPVPSAAPYILNIALEAQCLYPQPDQIKFVVYDEAYVAKFVGVYEDPYDGDYEELDTLNIYPIE